MVNLRRLLACFALEQLRLWSPWVSWVEWSYNPTFHASTGVAPFEIAYERKPVRFLPGETTVASVAMDLMNHDEALQQLKEHLQCAQQQPIYIPLLSRPSYMDQTMP